MAEDKWLNLEQLQEKYTGLAKSLYTENEIWHAPSMICHEAWIEHNMKTKSIMKYLKKIKYIMTKLGSRGIECYYQKKYIKKIENGKTEFLKVDRV